MQLTSERSYALLNRFGVFAREVCDKCGAILSAVRFTRKDESGAWCSRECRGDSERTAIRKGGRPRKYKTDDERLRAVRRQNAERQKAFRTKAQRNGKPRAGAKSNGESPRSVHETKDLREQNRLSRIATLNRPDLPVYEAEGVE